MTKIKFIFWYNFYVQKKPKFADTEEKYNDIYPHINVAEV